MYESGVAVTRQGQGGDKAPSLNKTFKGSGRVIVGEKITFPGSLELNNHFVSAFSCFLIFVSFLR